MKNKKTIDKHSNLFYNEYKVKKVFSHSSGGAKAAHWVHCPETRFESYGCNQWKRTIFYVVRNFFFLYFCGGNLIAK